MNRHKLREREEVSKRQRQRKIDGKGRNELTDRRKKITDGKDRNRTCIDCTATDRQTDGQKETEREKDNSNG